MTGIEIEPDSAEDTIVRIREVMRSVNLNADTKLLRIRDILSGVE